MIDIYNNFKKITILKSFNSNQIKVVHIYYMVSEIFTGETIESVEDNKDNLIFKKSKSDHSDE